MNLQPLLTTADLARLLGVSPRTVFRIIERDPTFPRAIRLSRKGTRYRQSDFERWLTEQTAAVAVPADLLTRAEAAALAGVSEAAVENWVEADRLKAWPGDRRVLHGPEDRGGYRVRKADVLELVSDLPAETRR